MNSDLFPGGQQPPFILDSGGSPSTAYHQLHSRIYGCLRVHFVQTNEFVHTEAVLAADTPQGIPRTNRVVTDVPPLHGFGHRFTKLGRLRVAHLVGHKNVHRPY